MSFKDLGYTPQQFLNTVRMELPETYRNMLPILDPDKTNFKGLGDVLSQDDNFANIWHRSAMNLVMKVLQRQNKITNPLAEYISEGVTTGDYMIETMMDVAEVHQFSPSAAEKKLFERRPPSLKSVIHRDKRDITMQKTFQDTVVTQIFQDVSSLNRYVVDITESMISGNEIDKYFKAKLTISEAISMGRVRVVDLGTATAKQLQKAILTYSKLMKHPSRDFNTGNVGQPDNNGETGIQTQADEEYLRMMLPVKTAVDINVDFLASAFHLDAVKSGLAIKEIDTFPNVYEYSKEHVVTEKDLANKFVSDYNYSVGNTLPAGTRATEAAYKDALALGEESDIKLVYDASRVQAFLHDKRTLGIGTVLPTTFGTTANSPGRYVNLSLAAKEIYAFSPFLPAVVILADIVEELPTDGVVGASAFAANTFNEEKFELEMQALKDKIDTLEKLAAEKAVTEEVAEEVSEEPTVKATARKTATKKTEAEKE